MPPYRFETAQFAEVTDEILSLESAVRASEAALVGGLVIMSPAASLRLCEQRHQQYPPAEGRPASGRYQRA